MIFRFKHWSLFIWTVLATIGLSIYPLISSNLASVHQSHNHSKNSSHLELAQESSGSTATSADTAPLFDNLGNHHYPISTNSELAQRYFDQGLILAYGFNHAEAARAFQEVARLDPNCAMAYWGLAYVLGPNINAPMAETAVSPAWQAIQQAMALRENATAKERALIEALAQRYAENPVADRSSLDLAYANAMRQVAQQYPDDLDIATLFAESLMDTTPWDYWEDNGEPKPEGAEIIAILESVRDRNLDHPGANHLYIHAVEKERPELAVDAADRLLNFAPGAGHLVHMPSHIYIRVGRYHDAVVSNQRGVAADQQYVHQHRLESIYPLVYMPHNHHFLWFAATMSGQSELATQAARDTAAPADQEAMRRPGLGVLQHFYSMPLYAFISFSQWDEILATPAPPEDLKYPTGVWHYARGMAFVAKGQREQATEEFEALRAIAADPELEQVTILVNSAYAIIQIAQEVLAGKLAAERGYYPQAIVHLRRAVDLEDNLTYSEPPDWHAPVRQYLAAVLLEAGRAAEAEQVYRQDLEIYPNNGWSLNGLAQSLRAQGKTAEADAVQSQFEDAWQYADITSTALR